LTRKDRRRLQARHELLKTPEHPIWATLSPERGDRARAALAILSR
jgi:hypothetical protein